MNLDSLLALTRASRYTVLPLPNVTSDYMAGKLLLTHVKLAMPMLQVLQWWCQKNMHQILSIVYGICMQGLMVHLQNHGNLIINSKGKIRFAHLNSWATRSMTVQEYYAGCSKSQV